MHPATGYSIARSLREAPQLAADMAEILRANASAQETASRVWEALWPDEKRRQVCAQWISLRVLGNFIATQGVMCLRRSVIPRTCLPKHAYFIFPGVEFQVPVRQTGVITLPILSVSLSQLSHEAVMYLLKLLSSVIRYQFLLSVMSVLYQTAFIVFHSPESAILSSIRRQRSTSSVWSCWCS